MKKIILICFLVFTNIIHGQNYKFFDSKRNSSDEIFKTELETILNDDSKLVSDFDIKSVNIVKIDVSENKYKVFYAKKGKNQQIETILIPMIYGKNLTAYQHGISSISLFTTPFKIRPKQGNTPQEVKSDLKNIGLYSSFFYLKKKTILNDGSIREHKGSFGLFIAPTSEEFNLQNTNNKVEKSNQLIISTGLAISYTYKNIVLNYIPFGIDYGTTSDKNDWIYNKKRWWGFGIGLDSKFFGI